MIDKQKSVSEENMSDSNNSNTKQKKKTIGEGVNPLAFKWLEQIKQEQVIALSMPVVNVCNGNLYDAAILTQIIYWHLPTKDGGSRLRAKRGEWLCKGYSDWESECGVKPKTARNCIDRLSASGLVQKSRFKFGGITQLHVRLNWEKLFELADFPEDIAQTVDTTDDEPTKCPNRSDGQETSESSDTNALSVPSALKGQMVNNPENPCAKNREHKSEHNRSSC